MPSLKMASNWSEAANRSPNEMVTAGEDGSSLISVLVLMTQLATLANSHLTILQQPTLAGRG